MGITLERHKKSFGKILKQKDCWIRQHSHRISKVRTIYINEEHGKIFFNKYL